MKLERIYLGKGFPYHVFFRDFYFHISPIKNKKKFWCRCKGNCQCKEFKFYAERIKK